MTSIESTMTQYYARRAAEYERIYSKPERQADLARLAGLLPRTLANEHVLEIACGTGFWTQRLAQTAASVLATDINEEVLDIARAKPMCGGQVSFCRADACDLLAFSGMFSAGLAMFWWSHVPRARLAGFLESFHRALLPNAVVVFADNRYVEGSSTPISRTDGDGNTYQQRTLEDGSAFEVVKNFPSIEEITATIEPVAREIEFELLDHYWFLKYRRR
jgi:SAM-dependent methyltransferase